jgi:hypothetical protein
MPSEAMKMSLLTPAAFIAAIIAAACLSTSPARLA